MADVIKTIEGFRAPDRVLRYLHYQDKRKNGAYWFTFGRGRPKQKVERLWFTHRSAVIGYFKIWFFDMYVGDLQDLVDGWMKENGNSLDDQTVTLAPFVDRQGNRWGPKPGTMLCFVRPPFHELTDEERVYFRGHQGFRYFNWEEMRIKETA